MDRIYLLSITKIVEGALKGEPEKVQAYCQQLAQHLDENGEGEASKRVRQMLGVTKARKFGLARGGESNGHRPANGHRVPVDSESGLSIADEELPAKGSVPLYVDDAVSDKLSTFLRYIRAADRLIAHGVGVSGSMLIYGPPGCGKTLMARHIASELQLPLLTARTDGLISSYLGSTAKNLRLLFDHAASRPCVLFLDEFDALAKMRDDGRELGELKRVVISLLQNIDALGRDHVLLAATNHEHLLDPAIWRRFGHKVRLDLPSRPVREKMIAHFLDGYATEEDSAAIAALTEGWSGAQLQELAADAVRAAVLRDERRIDLARLIKSIAARCASAQGGSDIAHQLRVLRDADSRTFTQTRLAELFGISQSHISRLLKTTGVTNGRASTNQGDLSESR